MYEIRDDLSVEDLPNPRKYSSGRSVKYPFPLLKPGQHFVVPLENGDDAWETQKRRLMAASWRYRRLYAPEKRFAVRYDDDSNTFRVFRLDDQPAEEEEGLDV